MRKYLSFFLLFITVSAFGAAYTSTQSGSFSSGSTWVGGVAPSVDGDTWTIAAGHTVVYDTDNSSQANGWGASVITGTLIITNTVDVDTTYRCYMNGNLSGAGSLIIGTAARPITFRSPSHLESIVVPFKSGSCTMSTDGGIQIYGSTNWMQGTLSQIAPLGTNVIVLDGNYGLTTNDVILISDINGTAGATSAGTVHIVASCVGNVVTLNTNFTTWNGITNSWWGMGFSTTISGHARTNSSVSLLNKSVVFGQPTKIASTSIFTGSNSNILQGVRGCNTGQSICANKTSWRCSYCVGHGNTISGIGYNCNGSQFTSCIGYGNSNGGIGNGCSGSQFTSCVGYGNSGGGIGYGCSGSQFTYCYGQTNTSANISYYIYGLITITATNYSFTDVANSGTHSTPFDLFSLNGTYFVGPFGTASNTPTTLSFSKQATVFRFTTTPYQVASFTPVAVRGTSISAKAYIWQTNGVGYSVSVTPHGVCCYGQTVYTFTNGLGWTNVPIVITNLPQGVPSLYDVWVVASGTSANTNGMSWVIPSTDYNASILK